MPPIVAIQPDDYTDPRSPDRCDASSPRWAAALKEAGYDIRWVDVYRSDILQQLDGCCGLMWRWAHFGGMYRIARRLLPIAERTLGLCVYPDQATCWHYDDKIAQTYLLTALGIPFPQTWVFHDANEASDWARTAKYPVVAKLAGGAGSTNVQLIHSREEVDALVRDLFARWHVQLPGARRHLLEDSKRRLAETLRMSIRGRILLDHFETEPQKMSILFQEFLPGNEFDTRITVIGRRAFGFRRMNRTGDFRASGSGQIDVSQSEIDPAFLRAAFQAADKLGTQSCAFDGLWKGDCPVFGEISYTYASWAVASCPGHWKLVGSPDHGEIRWVEGSMWPEDAQAADFIQRLRDRGHETT